ncbi:MAG: GIY-YIG nuclease family protein [candidate division Zixibacteria bacterium]|nr:GIY-YIG nuclease family protein [candidate division Zixibacteria bacterium]
MTEHKKQWYVYIVRCRDGSLYTGITDNLEKRLETHNRGKGAKFTARRRPVVLVYTEKQPDQGTARSREMQIKKWRRDKKVNLVEGFPRLRSG